jgi:hypothetical protein
LARAVFDLLLPYQRLSSNAMVGKKGALCLECFGQITFPGESYCDIYILSFELDVSEGSIRGIYARQDHAFGRWMI